MNDTATPGRPFERTILVRFGHTDPAGIVYYPRVFEMTNQVMEDWFAAMGTDFAHLHGPMRLGVPVVRLECDFTAPCHIGETLSFCLRLERLGRSAYTVVMQADGAGEPRLRARLTCVCMSLDTQRSAPLPPDLRAAMAAYLVPGDTGSTATRSHS